MTHAQLRALCLSFPEATENVQWGADLVFKVVSKMFAVTTAAAEGAGLSLRVDADDFGDLCERDGVRPAPYLARYFWVALDTLSTLPDDELTRRLRRSYDLVVATLPKKKRPAAS